MLRYHVKIEGGVVRTTSLFRIDEQDQQGRSVPARSRLLVSPAESSLARAAAAGQAKLSSLSQSK
eukprot:14997100-Heterocapsa_arctica.AAC.1